MTPTQNVDSLNDASSLDGLFFFAQICFTTTTTQSFRSASGARKKVKEVSFSSVSFSSSFFIKLLPVRTLHWAKKILSFFFFLSSHAGSQSVVGFCCSPGCLFFFLFFFFFLFLLATAAASAGLDAGRAAAARSLSLSRVTTAFCQHKAVTASL